MKRLLATVVIAIAIAIAVPGWTETVNRIAAVVDDEIITLYDIEKDAQAQMMMMRQQNGWTAEEAAAQMPALKQEILRAKIREKLFDHEVAKLGIPVSEKDIDDYIDYLLERSNLSQAQLREMLRRDGMTMTEYREMVAKKIRQEQYVQFRMKAGGLDVSDEEMRSFYSQNSERFLREPEVQLQEIRVNVTPNASPDAQMAAARRIQAAYERIQRGASFAKVARDISDSGSSSDGGDIGWFKLNTELKPAYSRVAAGLDVGQVAPPQPDGDDWFILRLTDRKHAEALPFEEVKDQIRNILYNRKVERQIEALTDELFQKSYVDIRVEDF